MDVADATRDVRSLFVACESARARVARAWGRSPVELSTLILVYLNGSVTPNAIATRMSLTSGSVTALLDRLEQSHLIERQANPDDRRSRLIEVTQDGVRLAETYLHAFDQIVGGAFGRLDDRSVRQVQAVLQEISAVLTEAEPPPNPLAR